jgi:CAAX prenyl protease-like protein
MIGLRWYLRAPFNFSWLSVAVGVVGIVVWIGLHWLDKQFLHVGEMFPPQRAAFNPFRELRHNPTWLSQFLAIRFAGLVLLVPLVEEFFLRGWLMRYIDDPDWDEIPLGEAGIWALVGIPIYAGMTHPNELIAAVVWFSMVTWLYLRTKSIWNCVIAHAITNLLLGLYVVQFGVWELW